MYFSADGNFLRLEDYETGISISIPSGEISEESSEIEWGDHSEISSWGNLSVISSSNKYLFEARTTHDEDFWEHEFSLREVRDAESGRLIATMADETIQITYDARHEPEGCDLSSFSFCGNVYTPSASLPYKARFSRNDQLVGILYRPPNLWNSNRYSSLRLYSVESGDVVGMFGSSSNPVEDFSFSPNSSHVLITYVDGSVHVLDTTSWDVAYASRDFQGVYDYLYIAPDYGLMFIESYQSLEVRSLIDGSLRGRYESSSFAIHPSSPQFAAADADGNIRIVDIATGSTSWSVKGHSAKVLSLAFSADGRFLISAGQDCRIKLWDLQAGTLLHEFEKTIVNAYGEEGTDSRIFLYFFEFIPDNDQVIGYGSWGTVVSWSINSGSTQFIIQPEPLEYYSGMKTLNPHFPANFGIDVNDGRIYLNDRMYDLNTGEKVGTYTIPESLPSGCYPIVLASQGSPLIFSPGYDARIGSFCVLSSSDLSLLREIKVFPGENELGTGINWIYPSADQRQLFVTTFNGPILIFQVVEVR
jgi:WD40 repeat protein